MPLEGVALDLNPVRDANLRYNLEKIKRWAKSVDQRLSLLVVQTDPNNPDPPTVIPQPRVTFNGTEDFLSKFYTDTTTTPNVLSLNNSIIKQDPSVAKIHTSGDSGITTGNYLYWATNNATAVASRVGGWQGTASNLLASIATTDRLGIGASGVTLTTSDYLAWAATPATAIGSRAASIRWNGTASPTRFEFDATTTTRYYLRSFASGANASLNFSPAEIVLTDSSTYSANPSTTVYRGLSLGGTVTIAAAQTVGGPELISNGDLESWEASAFAPDGWKAPYWAASYNTIRGTSAHGGSYSWHYPTTATGEGVWTRVGGDRINLNQPGSCYIQLTKNTAYTLTLWFKRGTIADHDLAIAVIVYANPSDVPGLHVYGLQGSIISGTTGTANTWVAGTYGGVNYGQPNITDTDWHQFTLNFDTNGVGALVGDPFYIHVDIRPQLVGGGGAYQCWIDDVSLRTTGTGLTLPVSVRGLSEDALSFVPTVSASGDTMTIAEVTGAYVKPTLAPSIISGGASTITLAHALRVGFAYTAPAGTMTVATAYSLYADAPGFGTIKYAGYFDGDVALSNANKLKLFEPSGSGTNFTSFRAQAQAADIEYQTPAAAPGADGYVATSTTAGVWSWASPASIVAAGQSFTRIFTFMGA